MLKCFVSNCENINGIQFPKDEQHKKVWLENLNIVGRVPQDVDFVCLDHFDANDLVNGETDIKEGAVPKCLPLQEEISSMMEEGIIELSDSAQINIKEIYTCRLCGLEVASAKHLTDLVDNIEVRTIINKCLFPFQITKDEEDKSKYVCLECYAALQNFYRYRSMIFERNNVVECEINKDVRSDKRKTDLEYESEVKKPKLIDGDVFKDDIERQLEEMENGVAPEEYLDSDVTFVTDSDNSDDYEIINATSKSHHIEKPHVVIAEKKYDHVEEELRRVLEGQLSEEQIQAENIIIAVEADEETNTRKASISQMKLPIVIKHVANGQQNKNSIIMDKEPNGSSQKKQKIPVKDGQVVLPKGISVRVPEKYTSDVGVYEGVPRLFIFNSEFCMVDDYLYEYRLCKGNLRYLRCISPNCKSLAMQKKLSSTEYSTSVTVKEPHNHQKPNEKEMKKQMFYHVMKRMMQNDKSMNFKSVYEQVCEIDPEIRTLVPLRNVIHEICRHQLSHKPPVISTFDQFYDKIEDDIYKKLHFTHGSKQFYQEKFEAEDDSKAIVFANCETIEEVSYSKLMYVDASFRIDSTDQFKYQLVTILVWVEESYYPILFALVNKKTQGIYKKILEYLHDILAPNLRPEEIVTDYEANLYYALGGTYVDSHIGGSVFYYTQNLYKKICSLNLSRDLEANSYFRNIYHMLLMLPLLPVNTILDGLNNIEIQARELGIMDLTQPLFEHIRTQWMQKVTPDLFCVHRLENRINENVIAPFKKLRDFLMFAKGKGAKHSSTIMGVVEKLIELESFLQTTYSAPNKKSFARDLSSSQKKNVLKAWQFIESHPKININNFFTKVLGYIKCMENQLWIWGFYRYTGGVEDDLINCVNFMIVSNDLEIANNKVIDEGEFADSENSVVMEAVIDENGGFVLQGDHEVDQSPFNNGFLNYVYKE